MISFCESHILFWDMGECIYRYRYNLFNYIDAIQLTRIPLKKNFYFSNVSLEVRI